MLGRRRRQTQGLDRNTSLFFTANKSLVPSFLSKQVIKNYVKKDDKCYLKCGSSKQKQKVLILGIIDLKSIDHKDFL